jgi:hypothetical protein
MSSLWVFQQQIKSLLKIIKRKESRKLNENKFLW